MRFLPISLLVLALYAQFTVAAESIRILLQNSPLAGSQYYAVSTSWNDIRVGDRLTLIKLRPEKKSIQEILEHLSFIRIVFLPLCAVPSRHRQHSVSSAMHPEKTERPENKKEQTIR